MLERIIYVSHECQPHGEKMLAAFCVEFARCNAALNVTGVLFHIGDRFMQVIEGRESVISALMQRIQKDSRHDRVQILLRDSIPRRAFSQWSMGLMDADALNARGEFGLADLYRLCRFVRNADHGVDRADETIRMANMIPPLMDAYRIV